LLSLPVAQALPGTSALDHLFTATSAVSTTGLVTVSPSGSYSLFGELVILLLIQIGGIGYMTMGSFIVLARGRSLSASRERLLASDFAMPKTFALNEFIRGVVIFTLVFETLGALALWALFAQAGVPNAGYQAVFHAISAFCTAGFSLFDTSLEAFASNAGVNAVIAALAYLGAIGFIVAVDLWRVGVGRQEGLTFTSRIILRLTLLLTVGGTVGLFLTEQASLSEVPAQRLMESFFQAMTAMTTVGFNTVSIGALSQGAMVLVLLLMIVGASPSGTGGGVKTTTLSAVYAVMRSVLRGQKEVTFWRRRVPADRVTAATASFSFYAVVLASGIFLLTLTEAADFKLLVFEATSALGTVGLSMGITGDLGALGKLVIVLLMFAGRLGPLSFGSALFLHDEDPAEPEEADVVL
jgi:trk system potassium uptake protein TrkH